VSKVDPDSTGLNPAWRKALAHIDWSQGWDEGASASEIDQIEGSTRKDSRKVVHFDRVKRLLQRGTFVDLWQEHRCSP
jgi:hypothetical protein